MSLPTSFCFRGPGRGHHSPHPAQCHHRHHPGSLINMRWWSAPSWSPTAIHQTNLLCAETHTPSHERCIEASCLWLIISLSDGHALSLLLNSGLTQATFQSEEKIPAVRETLKIWHWSILWPASLRNLAVSPSRPQYLDGWLIDWVRLNVFRWVQVID